MPTTCSLEEAVALLRPVDQIGFGLGPGIPDALLTAWEPVTTGRTCRSEVPSA